MAYDAYGGQQEEFNVKSTLADYITPASLIKYKYLYDPSTYSATKGLWTPVGGIADFKKGFTATRSAFKKGFWPGIKTAGKELWYFGPLGKDHRAAWSDPRNLQKAEQALRKTKSDISTSKRRISEINETLAKKARAVPKDTVLRGRAFEHQIRDYKMYSGKSSKLIAKHTQKITALESKLGSLNLKVFGGKMSEFGLKVGRGVTYGMWAMTLWEMGKMIGEPIGRYIVDNINRVSEEHSNRFSPEMGGKIALGYLSTGAATERQRAVEAISRSYINGRSALGQEAMFLHG